MTLDNWYYETIITKLDEIVAVMNTGECMEEIHNNNQLAELYFVLNSAMDKFHKVQRINKQGAVITADVKHQKNYRHRFSFDDRDTEEDCIERIQELIDTIYRVNPNLDYEYRPHIYLKVWIPEEERNKE